MKQSISILFFVVVYQMAFSQGSEKYWVFFKNKCSENFNPTEYFDQKAINRRIKNNLPLNHYSDHPVCEKYIEIVDSHVDSISHASRWFNCLAFYGSKIQVEQINKLDFVDSVRVISQPPSKQPIICEIIESKTPLSKKILSAQTKILGGELLQQNNLDGSGVRIAIFDAGFPEVDKSNTFTHIRDNNKIKATYDFVKNKEFVYKYSSHGADVLSCVGGVYDNQNVGLATGAEYLLARTENAASEPFSEEENWLAAAEWADKHGVQIINSSLAYTKHRYFTKEMNGQISLVSRAANMAASKGILVVNAAGNDGDNSWKYIGTPADADSVLTIGGINPYTNYHIDFSSFGPTSDKRMKPNVCAYGKVAVAGSNEIRIAQGTSFSSPLIAGYAACIWQLHPEYTNMQLFESIQQSAYLYPYYDYAHGFGMPNAAYYFEEKIKSLPTISFDETEKNIIFRVKDGEYEPTPFGDYLYYHIENTEGILNKYGIINIETQSPSSIEKNILNPGETLRVFYKGYIASYNY